MMVPALSELSVTELLTLSRAGFLPRGLCVGSAVYTAGTQYDWAVKTGEIKRLSTAMREARKIAVTRLREQAKALHADGIVQLRLEIEHHLWRGARQVVKCIAIGTAISFDSSHAPANLRTAPSLRLANGAPFDSDLSAADFVTLLASGYRPVTVAMGNCVYGLDPRELRNHRGKDEEILSYTQAFFDARELAMERLQEDLFRDWPPGNVDAPSGIVGMTVSEAAHGEQSGASPPVVEFTALGTAVAPLALDDPRRKIERPKPSLAVPLDT